MPGVPSPPSSIETFDAATLMMLVPSVAVDFSKTKFPLSVWPRMFSDRPSTSTLMNGPAAGRASATGPATVNVWWTGGDRVVDLNRDVRRRRRNRPRDIDGDRRRDLPGEARARDHERRRLGRTLRDGHEVGRAVAQLEHEPVAASLTTFSSSAVPRMPSLPAFLTCSKAKLPPSVWPTMTRLALSAVTRTNGPAGRLSVRSMPLT